MAKPIKTKDMKDWQGRLTLQAKAAADRTEFQMKTFEELTKPERDLLLKRVSVYLGLIKDSDDV